MKGKFLTILFCLCSVCGYSQTLVLTFHNKGDELNTVTWKILNGNDVVASGDESGIDYYDTIDSLKVVNDKELRQIKKHDVRLGAWHETISCKRWNTKSINQITLKHGDCLIILRGGNESRKIPVMFNEGDIEEYVSFEGSAPSASSDAEPIKCTFKLIKKSDKFTIDTLKVFYADRSFPVGFNGDGDFSFTVDQAALTSDKTEVFVHYTVKDHPYYKVDKVKLCEISRQSDPGKNKGTLREFLGKLKEKMASCKWLIWLLVALGVGAGAFAVYKKMLFLKDKLSSAIGEKHRGGSDEDDSQKNQKTQDTEKVSEKDSGKKEDSGEKTQDDTKADDLKQLMDNNKALQTENEKLQTEKQALQTENANLQTEKQALQTENANLQEKLNSANETIRQSDEQLRETKSQVEKHQKLLHKKDIIDNYVSRADHERVMKEKEMDFLKVSDDLHASQDTCKHKVAELKGAYDRIQDLESKLQEKDIELTKCKASVELVKEVVKKKNVHYILQLKETLEDIDSRFKDVYQDIDDATIKNGLIMPMIKGVSGLGAGIMSWKEDFHAKIEVDSKGFWGGDFLTMDESEVKEKISKNFISNIVKSDSFSKFVRLYHLSNVPFIKRQFENAGMNVAVLEELYYKLYALVTNFDHQIICPRLFKEQYAETRYQWFGSTNLFDILVLSESDRDAIKKMGSEIIIDVNQIGYKSPWASRNATVVTPDF